MNRKKDYFCTTIKFIENPTQTHWMKHYPYDPHGNWVKCVRYEGSSDDSMTATEVTERKIEYYEWLTVN